LRAHERQKGFITMSNVLSDKKRSFSAAEIKPRLISSMESMVKLLEADKVPASDSCTELQVLFQQYVTTLSETASVSEVLQEDLQINFTDTPGEDVKSNDIIADLLHDPAVIEALFTIGLRKLSREEELPLSDEQRAWLIDKGYISPLSIASDCDRDSYIVLTSKGWLCFQRSFITQQLRKQLGYTTLLLPEWLAVPQTKWGSAAYRRAVILRSYYMNSVKMRDFMVFSFPENTNLLFGCSANKTMETEYACAVIDNLTFTKEEVKTLLKVIGADVVSKVHMICSDESIGTKALDALKLTVALSKKTDLIVLEETNE